MADSKNQRMMKRMKVAQVPVIDRNQLDKFVFDVVLKTLYNNADIDAIHLENEIYKPNGIQLPRKEAERLWAVMLSSGWVAAVIGFGNSGKVELTREGYQLMAQYGGYSEYLAAVSASQQPTIILPFQAEDAKATPAVPAEQKNQQAAQQNDNK